MALAEAFEYLAPDDSPWAPSDPAAQEAERRIRTLRAKQRMQELSRGRWMAAHFGTLADEWEASGWHATVEERTRDRSYGAIIRMGPDVVDLVIARLRAKPDWWFDALAAITGEDPVADGASFDEARDAWLAWAEHRRIGA